MGKVEIFADMINLPENECSHVAGLNTKVFNLSAIQECGTPHKKIALEIERFHNDEDVEFHISSKKEKLSILHSIANQGARVCMYFGSDQHFIITTLHGVNEYGMWLNVGPLPLESKRLLLSNEITFVSIHQHAKIQFVVCNIANRLLENNDALLYVELPDSLLRIQRREFFRSAIPSNDLVRCMIPIQPENPGDQVIMYAAPIVNISGGGIRLLCDGHKATLLPNETFTGCQISLPDTGTLTVTIEVRNNISFTTSNKVYTHVGCRFIYLDKQINILLQRQINCLQGESLARRSLAVLC